IFCKTSLLLENLAFAKTLMANALVALMQEDRRQTFFTAIESLIFAKTLMVNTSPQFHLCLEKGNISSYTQKRESHFFEISLFLLHFSFVFTFRYNYTFCITALIWIHVYIPALWHYLINVTHA